MIHIKETIIVEGKYDKIRLSSFVDGNIIETNGFRIFKDKEMRRYLKRLAAETGIVILTDSDQAGFLIRRHIKSFLPSEQIKQAYVPEIKGVEKRKKKPSKEGLLGVEGIDEATIVKALQEAGCGLGQQQQKKMRLTEAVLYAGGLLGNPQSAQLRKEFCRKSGFPSHLSSKEFLHAVNCFMTREEYKKQLQELSDEKIRN